MRDKKKLNDGIQAVEHASRCYAVLAKHLPFSTTLAELIVLSEVAKGVYLNRPVSVSEIVNTSGISRWSVSRTVLRYVESGAIVESKDPKDSRRKLLCWTPVFHQKASKWVEDWMRLM